MGKRATLLLFAFAYLAVLIAFAPASLLDVALHRASGDRLALANASGTIWNGTALLSLRQRDGKLIALQPLQWEISALSLLTGKIRVQLRADEQVPSAATELVASYSRIELRHAQFRLPAQILNEASPILKPARFRGQLDIRSENLAFTPRGMEGIATVDWRQAGSVLSRIAPLGDYRLTLNGTDMRIHVNLATTAGVLLLDGQGDWQAPRGLELHVNARAAPGSEDSLAELLHHLGPQTAPGVHSFNLVPQ